MDPEDEVFAECWSEIVQACAKTDVRAEDVMEVISGLYAQGRDRPQIECLPGGIVQLAWSDGLEVTVGSR